MPSCNEDARAILGHAHTAFSSRGAYMSLLQEIAEHFYPERADFTYQRYLGDSFADNLSDSAPPLIRRELGDSITSMLRPAGKDWGAMTTNFEDALRHDSRMWLQWAWKRQRAAMYDRAAMFTRATKEGDHDFAAFGECIIHVGTNRQRNGFLFKNHHIRDCAWKENADKVIDQIFLKQTLTAVELARLFKDVHPNVTRDANDPKKMFRDVSFMHIIVPASYYGEVKTNHPFMSLYIDTANNWVMEARPSRRKEYVIPRWQTVSGSQYAFSPATIIGLPDARTIQSIGITLLEAGERSADPPMVATQDAVRGDMRLHAGGVTWVDAEYDERLGEALRPLTQNHNMPVGFEMSDRHKEQLRDAFYLNQIGGMPLIDKVMTAYEAAEHVKNYIRQALPLFEPMENDYNGGLCDEVFTAMFWMGGFGSPWDIPDQLQGEDVVFKFKTPLRDAMNKEKSGQFMEMFGLTEAAVAADPTVITHIDVSTAFRDSLEGLEIPSKWLRDEEEAKEMIADAKAEQNTEKAIMKAAALADTAKVAGEAGVAMEGAANVG